MTDTQPAVKPPGIPAKPSIKRPTPALMSLNLDGLTEEKESHALTVECSSSRSPRIGGLSLELGSSPRGPHVMEDSWKARARLPPARARRRRRAAARAPRSRS